MHILAVAISLALAAGHPHKIKIAVLDVQDVSGDQAAHARALTQLVSGEVARDGTIDVVSSSQIRDLLGFEKQKQLLGCNQNGCLAEIGGALGVDYLLTGQLAKLGSRYRFDLSLINQVEAHTDATVGELLPAQDDALVDTAVRMTNELLVKAGLRSEATAALDEKVGASAAVSHTGAYTAFGVGAVLAIAAGIMTGVTAMTYSKSKDEYGANPSLNPSTTSSDAGKQLHWMGPLTDGLWAGSIIALGTGTILYFTASPSGSGGEVGVGGSF